MDEINNTLISFPVRHITAKVHAIEQLSGYVTRLLIQQPENPLQYCAGQYVEIINAQAIAKPFSIANKPNADHIEFHIRHLANNDFTANLLEEITLQQQVKLLGPYGAMAYQNKPQYPLLLIAGGTGFAPFKAIIEQALSDKNRSTIYLYWGARTKEDLYWHDQILAWTKQHGNFYYIPVLSQPLSADNWQGDVGLVHDVVLKQHQTLACYHIYASGPPEMVYAAQKSFLLKNMSEKFFYSDLLDYLPS